MVRRAERLLPGAVDRALVAETEPALSYPIVPLDLAPRSPELLSLITSGRLAARLSGPAAFPRCAKAVDDTEVADIRRQDFSSIVCSRLFPPSHTITSLNPRGSMLADIRRP
jgi:hypothetical protein